MQSRPKRQKNIFTLIVILLLLVFAVSAVSGCGQEQEPVTQEPKPVEIITVAEEHTPRSLRYVGSVEPKDSLQLGFKTGGKVSEVLVSQEQWVVQGQHLVELDNKELTTGLRGAKSRLQAAQAQYAQVATGASEEVIQQAVQGVRRAADSYEFAQDYHKKMQTLYESGAIAKHELEQAKLEVDLRQTELTQAQERLKELELGATEDELQVLSSQVDGARAEVERFQQLLQETVLRASTGGQVIELSAKVGEIVGAGQPLVVLAAGGQTVKTSVPARDMDLIDSELEVLISSGSQQTITGEIIRIASTPDRHTRTYPLEIAVAEEDLLEDTFILGQVVQVKILLGSELATWIPLGAVLAAEQDYVYVVEEDIAVPRPVTILGTRGSQVQVDGVAAGEQLVVRGMNRLQADDIVSIQGQGEQL